MSPTSPSAPHAGDPTSRDHGSGDRTSRGPETWTIRQAVGRITRVLLWFLLVVMLVSLIVQSSAVAASSSADEPLVERLSPAPADGSGPVPNAGDGSTDSVVAASDAEPATPLAKTFDGSIEATFPPLTTTSSRIRDTDFFETHEERINEEDAVLLKNDARANIYDEITQSPGVSMSEIAEQTGIPLSTVRYHTWVLSKESVVDEAKIRGKRRVFPTMMDHERKELNAALADEATARMLDSIRSHEPASVSELAESLDRSASTVSYHLQRLQDAGLVERERDGGATVTRLDPFVRAELSGAVQADGGAASEASGTPSDQSPDGGSANGRTSVEPSDDA